MNLFDMFKSNKKTVKRERTINGIPITQLPDDVYENIFPWANNRIPNTNLTAGNIVMLWWLDKYHGTGRKIPDYFEKNYVSSFQKEFNRLKRQKWIFGDGSLTSEGKNILANNFDIIEKHRNGWMSNTDLETFEEARIMEMNNHIKWLENNGLDDMAKRSKKMMLQEEKNMAIARKFKKSETMSKNNELEEANKVLEHLLKEQPESTAPIYERLAKNYRKQKRYQDEINLCMRFLKDEQQKYGGDQWIDVFERRIAFCQKKLF